MIKSLFYHDVNWKRFDFTKNKNNPIYLKLENVMQKIISWHTLHCMNTSDSETYVCMYGFINKLIPT